MNYLNELKKLEILHVDNYQYIEIKKLNKPTSLNAMTEEQILERLALSRTEAANGNYKDADSVLESIRAKYEL